jgi:hypothetical protein
MKYYNVPEVSIAFFRAGRIDWARGYGLADTDKQTGYARHFVSGRIYQQIRNCVCSAATRTAGKAEFG